MFCQIQSHTIPKIIYIYTYSNLKSNRAKTWQYPQMTSKQMRIFNFLMFSLFLAREFSYFCYFHGSSRARLVSSSLFTCLFLIFFVYSCIFLHFFFYFCIFIFISCELFSNLNRELQHWFLHRNRWILSFTSSYLHTLSIHALNLTIYMWIIIV